jgi:hypothetical protein
MKFLFLGLKILIFWLFGPGGKVNVNPKSKLDLGSGSLSLKRPSSSKNS